MKAMSETEKNTQGQKHQVSQLAIWSMALGILGFLVQCFSLIAAFLCGTGLIFGVIALRKITKSNGLLTGRGFAVTGLILSLLGFFVPTMKLLHYVQFFRQAQVVKIDDAASKTLLTLSPAGDPNEVDGISILITGRIDGSATVHIRNGGTTYPARQIRKGLVFIKIEGDWHTSKCFLEYEPSTVQNGHLTIRYVLWDKIYFAKKLITKSTIVKWCGEDFIRGYK